MLDVNFDKSKSLNSLLEKLDRGQGIIFNATLKNFHVTTPNHVHLVGRPHPGRHPADQRLQRNPRRRADEQQVRLRVREEQAVQADRKCFERGAAELISLDSFVHQEAELAAYYVPQFVLHHDDVLAVVAEVRREVREGSSPLV